MQHQSQEHHQPKSSEFVPFEQPQAYRPQPPVYVPPYQQSAQEMPLFSEQGQEQIVIYPNRGQIIGRTALMAGALLFEILIMLVLFGIIFTFDSSFDSPAIPLLFFLLAFFLTLAALVGWMTWDMISMIFPQPKPVLIINSEGIRVSKMPMQPGFFIAWSEIDAVFSTSFMYKFICISPKNNDHYLSRFHFLDRLNRRLNTLFYGSPLYFPQIYMARPVDEVIHRIYAQYQRELSHYRIRLHR